MTFFPEVISLVLALVYSLMFFLFVCRAWRIYWNAWSQTQMFYAAVTAHSLLRACTFYLQAADQSPSPKLEYLLLYAPDSLFVLAYLLLFWVLLVVEVRSHMDLGNARSAGPRLRRVAAHIWKAVLLWLICETGCYALYLGDVMDGNVKLFEISVVNVAMAGFVFSCLLALQVSFSGIPFKSKLFTQRHYLVLFAAFVWSVGRLIRGVLGVLYSRPIPEAANDAQPSAEALLIAVLMCTEVLCYLAVLDYGHIPLFFISQEDDQGSITEQLVANKGLNDLSGFEVNQQLVYSGAAVECTHQMYSRPTGFGKVFLAKFNEQIVFYRRVNFKRLSNYIKEEAMEELLAIKAVTSEHIAPFLGCTLEGNVLGLLFTYYHQGSLFSLLHEAKEELTYEAKISIARDLAMGMRDLYYQGQAHGHLTSHNVLLESNKIVMISDFGLERMKKFAGLMTGYCNKSGWTSPEQLLAEGPVATQVRESDDVYSFGVILWELLTSRLPFPDLPPEDIKHVVAELNNRPELTGDIDEVMAKLIKSCWNISAEKRPTFKLIYSTLCLIPSS